MHSSAWLVATLLAISVTPGFAAAIDTRDIFSQDLAHQVKREYAEDIVRRAGSGDPNAVLMVREMVDEAISRRNFEDLMTDFVKRGLEEREDYELYARDNSGLTEREFNDLLTRELYARGKDKEGSFFHRVHKKVHKFFHPHHHHHTNHQDNDQGGYNQGGSNMGGSMDMSTSNDPTSSPPSTGNVDASTTQDSSTVDSTTDPSTNPTPDNSAQSTSKSSKAKSSSSGPNSSTPPGPTLKRRESSPPSRKRRELERDLLRRTYEELYARNFYDLD